MTGQIFLSDTLENGAGYSTHLGEPEITEQLLRMISEPGQSYYDGLVADRHMHACMTSCPDCLRSYNNLAYHSLLDWRLGVDMATLALDQAAPISLTEPRWLEATTQAIVTLRAARAGFQETEIAGLPALVSDQEALILAHPLWFTELGRRGPELRAAFDEATQGRGLSVGDESFMSVFNALRRPI